MNNLFCAMMAFLTLTCSVHADDPWVFSDRGEADPWVFTEHGEVSPEMPATPAVSEPAEEEPEAEEPQSTLSDRMFSVRARTPRVTHGTTAIAVNSTQLVTVSHLTEGLYRPAVEVLIDDVWMPVQITLVSGHDVAIVTVPQPLDVDPVKVRSPRYFEPVTVVGQMTGEQAGLYTDDDTVSLHTSETGDTTRRQRWRCVWQRRCLFGCRPVTESW